MLAALFAFLALLVPLSGSASAAHVYATSHDFALDAWLGGATERFGAPSGLGAMRATLDWAADAPVALGGGDARVRIFAPDGGLALDAPLPTQLPARATATLPGAAGEWRDAFVGEAPAHVDVTIDRP
jgi:hypothetical protein